MTSAGKVFPAQRVQEFCTECLRKAGLSPDSSAIIAESLVLAEAREKAAIEAVYVDSQGWVREGTTSNLFAFFGGTLVTPGEGILSGITRQKVLGIAEGNYTVQIRDLQRGELVAADEVFITSSNRLIVPIVQVDEAGIGTGKPGERTRALMQTFADYTARLSATRE
jgi:branched-chain amino acid aminotransferase